MNLVYTTDVYLLLIEEASFFKIFQIVEIVNASVSQLTICYFN